MDKDKSSGSIAWNNKKCDCRYAGKVYFVAAAGCADDDAAVAALPDQWEPMRSGPILANYLKDREQNHDTVLKDLADKAKTVNADVDNKIRALAETLLAHIQHNQEEIDCIVEKCNNGEQNLETEVRDDAFKRIYQLYSKRIDDMARFKREAALFERVRADGLRNVLRDQFQRLISVGHRPPKDLLHDFDERVYEVNQQLLSNNRAYTELEAQLRVQADESIVRARSSINQLCLGICGVNRGHSALAWTAEKQLSQRSSSAIGDKKREQSSSQSIGQLLNEVQGIDECVALLVQAYKAAVMRVFAGFSSKLSDLEKDLGTHRAFGELSHTCENIEFNQMLEKTVCRLSNSIHKKHMASPELLEVTATDMLAMQKSLWSLGECLQDTYNILHDAGHLWDTHILREALAQKLTIAAVEDLFTSNDTLELANEVIFNVALEQLRGSADAEKLQMQYDSIMQLLDKTADMYLNHSEAELGRLEEFMNLPTSLANTLLSEFDVFLEKYPRSVQSVGSRSSQTGLPTIRTTANNLQSPLPRAIIQTELEEVALRNWRNGFLETFQSNVILVPEELRRQARLWVEERANALHMRFSLKMVSHSIRVERVNAAREARLAELHHHDARLDSHLAAIYDITERLPSEAAEFCALDAPYLYPFVDWLKRIQTDMDGLLAQDPVDPEVKRLKMTSYVPRLAKHRALFEDSLLAVFEAFKRQMEHIIQNARISNVRFMAHLIIFNEGGRYAAQEATRTCSALVKGADALEACVNKIMDALNTRRMQLLSQADQLLTPIQKIIEETVKGKGGLAKGKPPPPGKKK